MKNNIIIAFCAAALLFTIASCKKDAKPVATDISKTLEGQVLTDFSNQLVNPNYQDIQANAAIMLTAVNTLNTTTTEANLLAARNAWKSTRAAWEKCEGFLFGPVEDFNYDPTMDDWPVNKVELDSLLASTNPLSINDITPLTTTLKGFHAIEYIIFGVGGTKKAAQITAREKVYLASLAQSLYNTTTELRNSWDPSQPNNFTVEVTTAGNGSTRYATRKEFFLALVGSMADICNEVANEKMQIPFAAQDSTLDESSFSHNSTIDFTNNITGVLNAYLSKYHNAGGHSLSELVRTKNTSLDINIQNQANTAIASFNGITLPYEKAIYTQQNQIKTVQAAIRKLQGTLEGELADFIEANIKD
jgi:predicted lipoprotein